MLVLLLVLLALLPVVVLPHPHLFVDERREKERKTSSDGPGKYDDSSDRLLIAMRGLGVIGVIAAVVVVCIRHFLFITVVKLKIQPLTTKSIRIHEAKYGDERRRPIKMCEG